MKIIYRQFLSALTRKEIVSSSLLIIYQLMLGLLDLLAVVSLSALTLIGIGKNNTSGTGLVDFLSTHGISLKNAISLLLVISLVSLSLKSILSFMVTRKLFDLMARIQIRLNLDFFRLIKMLEARRIMNLSRTSLPISMSEGAKCAIVGVLGFSIVFISETLLLFVLVLPLLILFPFTLLILLLTFTASFYLMHKKVGQIAQNNGSLKISSENDVRSWVERIGTLSFLDSIRLKKTTLDNRLDTAIEEAAIANVKLHFIQQIPKYFLELVIVIAGALTIISFLLISDLDRAMHAGTLLLAISFRVVPSILRMQGAILFIKSNLEQGLGFLNEYLDLKDKSKRLLKESNGRMNTYDPSASRAYILIENLSFKFADSDEYLFSDLNCKIGPGGLTLISGDSGRGKTTLVNLILSHEIPELGDVNYISDKPDGLVIAYMPQSTVVIPGNLVENVAIGVAHEDVDFKILDEVLSLSGLAKDGVSKFDLKKSKSDDFGRNISGGEVQRIGLARALYLKPDILILDEPTSALDDSTENSIIGNIKNISELITVVVISHSKKYLELADEIIEI